jgi:putative glutamine amidotransferase
MTRIAIPVPTSADAAYNMRSLPHYFAAVHEAGAQPVEIALTLSRAEQKALAATCDGILLPGSPADVDPARYGAERDPSTAPPDPAREALDYLLLDHAGALAKPVLGICFGVQSMNVWRGGSLVQDLLPTPVNHAAGGSVAIAHTALIAKESLLATLCNLDEATADRDFLRLPINTSHHQSIAEPGTGLRIVARCPEDGVIEAIEADPAFSPPHPGRPRQFLLGVQWHPERSTAISATSCNLFRALVEESEAFAARSAAAA